MNQRMLRTLMFVGAAAICVGGAIATSIATRPVKLDDAALVGEEFFPDFQDATKATGLRVAAYDKDTARVNLFNVEFNDGLWRIPSHHNYPADGEDQLAKTAASVVGIERGLYSGKTPEDQKRMGVLDPLDDSITGTEGRGARITLFQAGKELVDLIVGDKVDEAGNIYYVRKADENRVFRAELTGLKVSTKFADWIEPDLLKLDRNKLVQMVIDRYRIDEQRGSLVQGDISILTKDADDTTAQWELEELDAEVEKIKTATVNQMTTALDDLKIVGVREKPAGLVAALKGEQGSGLNQIEQIQMQRAGYFLTPDGQLVSNEGEILAGTNEGVRYTLRFGEVLSGSDLEIEVGAEIDENAETGADADAAAEDAEESDDASGDDADDEGDDTVKKNRYVFITATFDEKLLGERPKAPVKPVPPTESQAEPTGDDDPTAETPPSDNAAAEEQTDSEASEAAADESGNSDDQPAADASESAEPDAEAGEDSAEPETDASANEAADSEGENSDAAEEPDPEQVFKEAESKYEADLAAYEAQNKAFDAKIEKGQELAKELNDRFAPWYYVISADLFQKLKVDRAELVEAVTPEADSPGTDGPVTSPLSLPADSAAEPDASSDEGKSDTTEAPSSDAADTEGDQPAADSPADAGDSPTPSEQTTSDEPSDPPAAEKTSDSPENSDSSPDGAEETSAPGDTAAETTP